MDTRRDLSAVTHDDIVDAIASFGRDGVDIAWTSCDDGGDVSGPDAADDILRICVALGLAEYGRNGRHTAVERVLRARIDGMARLHAGVEFDRYGARVQLTSRSWANRLAQKSEFEIECMLEGIKTDDRS